MQHTNTHTVTDTHIHRRKERKNPRFGKTQNTIKTTSTKRNSKRSQWNCHFNAGWYFIRKSAQIQFYDACNLILCDILLMLLLLAVAASEEENAKQTTNWLVCTETSTTRWKHCFEILLRNINSLCVGFYLLDFTFSDFLIRLRLSV